ncbi:hypothetical protein HDU97_006686 [Phlyctochytrium planicorne]|nr:hypothetical protein HDU97_006686 [Phlyctochytrium planicorne]
MGNGASKNGGKEHTSAAAHSDARHQQQTQQHHAPSQATKPSTEEHKITERANEKRHQPPPPQLPMIEESTMDASEDPTAAGPSFADDTFEDRKYSFDKEKFVRANKESADPIPAVKESYKKKEFQYLEESDILLMDEILQETDGI